MAFGLTTLRCYGIETDQPTTKRFKQIVEMEITGTTADVALDLGNYTGTFWTAVNSSEKLAAWKEVISKADKTASVYCPELDAKALVRSGATLAANEYKKVTTPTTSFAITIYTGEGLTSYNLVIEFILEAGQPPVRYNA